MLDRLRSTINELKHNAPRIAPEILSENIAFLEWLAANHFTFLGCRDYRYEHAEGGRLSAVPESGLEASSPLASSPLIAMIML